MKKVMFAILALPLLAGCFWNKQDDVEKNTSDAIAMANDEDKVSPEIIEAIEAAESDDNVDEK